MQRIATVALVLAYVATLRLSYTTIIVPRFGYLGYSYSSPAPASEAGMLLLALLPALLLPVTLRRPSSYVLWFLYTIVLIPAMLMPIYTSALDWPAAVRLGIVMLVCFLLLLAAARLPRVRIPALRMPESLFWLGMLGFVALALLAIRAVFGVPLSIPTLAEVYQRRDQFKATVEGSGSGVVYLIVWLANVINPLLMARALLARRWVWGMIGLISQVALFSISGFKSVLLAPVLLVGLAVILSDRGKSYGVRFLTVLVLFVGLGLVLDPVLPVNPLTNLFVRRLIVTPGVLTGHYVAFFSSHPQALLGYGVFRHLADNVYGHSPALVIGELLSPGQTLDANANFWADAFANFGYGGMLIFSVLLGTILWLYDSLALGKRLGYSVLLIAMPTFSLTNSALLTCLATHGLGLALAVVALLPKQPPFRGQPDD
jgi:hypothetical protein